MGMLDSSSMLSNMVWDIMVFEYWLDGESDRWWTWVILVGLVQNHGLGLVRCDIWHNRHGLVEQQSLSLFAVVDGGGMDHRLHRTEVCC